MKNASTNGAASRNDTVSTAHTASTPSPADKKPRPVRKPVFVWPTARRPVWINDAEVECLPNDARQETIELVASAYQELVVEATSALERVAGEEYVFLFWIGLVRSMRLRGFSSVTLSSLIGRNPEVELQQYLQLGLAKQRVANLLMRVRDWQARWRRDEPPRPASVQAPPTEPATQPSPIVAGEGATAEKACPAGGQQHNGHSGRNGTEAAARPHLATVPKSDAPRPASVRGVPHSSASRCAAGPQVETDTSSPDSGQASQLEKRESGAQNGMRLLEGVTGSA